MLPSLMIIREYISKNGTSPFSKWFNKLNSQAIKLHQEYKQRKKK